MISVEIHIMAWVLVQGLAELMMENWNTLREMRRITKKHSLDINYIGNAFDREESLSARVQNVSVKTSSLSARLQKLSGKVNVEQAWPYEIGRAFNTNLGV